MVGLNFMCFEISPTGMGAWLSSEIMHPIPKDKTIAFGLIEERI